MVDQEVSFYQILGEGPFVVCSLVEVDANDYNMFDPSTEYIKSNFHLESIQIQGLHEQFGVPSRLGCQRASIGIPTLNTATLKNRKHERKQERLNFIKLSTVSPRRTEKTFLLPIFPTAKSQ